MNNFIKTAVLLSILTVLLVLFGGAVGGENGMMTAFLFACVMNFGAYWFSDSMVLSMSRAVLLPEETAPEVYAIVRELTAEAGLPMPKIYLIPSTALNAFATGRNPAHAAVAVTQGIVTALNREELKGVLAHELAHVEHRDILISSIAATLAGAISMLASMLRYGMMFGGSRRDEREEHSNPLALLVMSIVIPFAALLIQMAVSRSRELDADERGAKLSGNPLYLASALQKLDSAQKQIPLQGVEPATAHLYIVNPLKPDFFMKLFSTHPPIAERIARLEEMARREGL